MNKKDLFKLLEHSDEAAKNWHKARHYVLEINPHIDGEEGIGSTSNKHVHVCIEIEEDAPLDTIQLMMAITRQVALIAHYPNFDEYDESTRTIVTIFYKEGSKYNVKQLKKQLTSHLGNLLDYCQFRIDGEDVKNDYLKYKDYMPLDIAFELTKELGSSLCPNDDENAIRKSFNSRAVEEYFRSNLVESEIDLQPAMWVNMAYYTGADIENLPAYDNANIKRYETALNVFCYIIENDKTIQKWNSTLLKNQLSCLFCVDCIKERLDGILDTRLQSIEDYLTMDIGKVHEAIEKNIEALALCEHSRWNVEKLIMGFAPLTDKDFYEIDSRFGENRKNKIREFKNNSKHIDLCSYKNLRRLDPGNIKYDYFLMLAVPYILKKALRINTK